MKYWTKDEGIQRPLPLLHPLPLSTIISMKMSELWEARVTKKTSYTLHLDRWGGVCVCGACVEGVPSRDFHNITSWRGREAVYWLWLSVTFWLNIKLGTTVRRDGKPFVGSLLNIEYVNPKHFCFILEIFYILPRKSERRKEIKGKV